MSRTVYVLEPQALFIPELSRIVTAAGGHVARFARSLDIDEVSLLRVEFALLDLDYTHYGVPDGLAYFHGAAPEIQTLVLTEASDFETLKQYREAGATAVLPKAMSADDLIAALREIFQPRPPRVVYEETVQPRPRTATGRRLLRGDFAFIDERV